MPKDSASAGSGVGRKRQGMHLGNERVIQIVCGNQGSLFGGSDIGGLGRFDGFACEQPFVSAIAKLPEFEAHSQRNDEEGYEEDLLVARGIMAGGPPSGWGRIATRAQPQQGRRRREPGSRDCRARR